MRIIEFSSRVAEDQTKLSLHAADIANLLRESDYWARQVGAEQIGEEHVAKALSSAEYRSSRIRDQVFESIRDGTTLIDTQGLKVGQINALSVLSTGDHEFGMPNRVTATYRYGDGEVIDIERDVALAGAIHSKGMMILSAFLTSTFGKTAPLKIAASLTFEQSYNEVDGDSASMAEFCALISAISGIPIQQHFAITGSMNQFGEAQPVGGVNEKIEGFFATCEIQGVASGQGVIIPRTNVHNLMLKETVVNAARAKRFSIYAVSNVLEALQILTGKNVGKPNKDGRYPKGTLFGEVQARLDLLRKYEKRHH
jgi:predicted ATP-dependent protease